MAIKITSDTTCDLPEELLKRYDITLLPLYVSCGPDTYRDGVDVHPADLFSFVDRSGQLPSTAAVNVADYAECFARLAPNYDAVIHFNIGCEFSSCHQNASLAAQEFDNVYVVDTRSLSGGHGLVLLEAAIAADRGDSAEMILAHVKDVIPRVDASFVLDRLDYLVKGGRCSSAAALGANLLKLKPCIEVADGKMHVGKKYRGSFEKALKDYVKDRLSDATSIDPSRVLLVHTDCPDGVVETVLAEIEAYVHFEETLEAVAGSTISCHCGPNTLGFMFLRKN
jgi:DegV family protein with EDD domain